MDYILAIWAKIAGLPSATLAAWAQAILLLATVVAAIVYATIARRQWESQKQALEYDAFARYAQHHNSQRSYLMRRFIHLDFENVLRRVVANLKATVPTADWTENIFNRALAAEKDKGGDFDALEAAECVMMDFDMLAVPIIRLKSKSAMKVAESYKPVFKAVTEKIRLFVRIKAELRDKTLREYKPDFIGLLEKLCVLYELKLQKLVDERLDLQTLLNVP